MTALTLSHIEFGPTGATPTGRALPARRNRSAPVSTRWTNGEGLNGVVYSLAALEDAKSAKSKSPTMTVDVTLDVTADQPRSIWIRATLYSGSSRLLGELRPTRGTIPAGQTSVVFTGTLMGVDLEASGVSRSVVRWRWEWADSEQGSYTAFGESEHRLYVILRPPRYPWAEFAGAPGEVIWTEVLDWSCRWAAGTKSLRDAAAAISRRIHELGDLGFTAYRRSETFHWQGRNNQIVAGAFRCSWFLSLLTGETFDVHPYGNCTDLAAIVVTFSNSLGCELGVFRVCDPGGLDTNPLRLIGRDEKSTRTGMPSSGFPYHDMAGEGRGQKPTLVYDACVALDADDNPGRPPRFWTSPAGIRRRGTGSYETHLLKPAGRKNIIWTREKTYPVDSVIPGTVPAPSEIWLERFQRYRELLGAPASPAVQSSSNRVDAYVFSEDAIQVRTLTTHFSGVIEEQIWTADRRESAAAPIFFSVFPCSGPQMARAVTAEVLAWCQPSFALAQNDGGPPVLLDATGTLGGFTAGNQAVLVNGDRTEVAAFAQALAVQMQ